MAEQESTNIEKLFAEANEALNRKSVNVTAETYHSWFTCPVHNSQFQGSHYCVYCGVDKHDAIVNLAKWLKQNEHQSLTVLMETFVRFGITKKNDLRAIFSQYFHLS